MLERIRSLDAGADLPTYAELAAELGCSLAPVKQAARELAAEGRISLRRGRAAHVLWTGSFSDSTKRFGGRLENRLFQGAYRPLGSNETNVATTFALALDASCIVCGRVRLVDGHAVALSLAYINPVFFAEPARFFIDYDFPTESLRAIYASLKLQPLRIPAVVRPALASARDQELLGIPAVAPVLHVEQQLWVEWRGAAVVLEVMHATYTTEIDYRVDRLMHWTLQEPRI